MTRTHYTEAKDLKRDLMSMFVENGLGILATIRRRDNFDLLTPQTQNELSRFITTLGEGRNDPSDLPDGMIDELVHLQEQVEQELNQAVPSEPSIDELLRKYDVKESRPKHSGTFKPAAPRDNWFKRLMRWAREEN